MASVGDPGDQDGPEAREPAAPAAPRAGDPPDPAAGPVASRQPEDSRADPVSVPGPESPGTYREGLRRTAARWRSRVFRAAEKTRPPQRPAPARPGRRRSGDPGSATDPAVVVGPARTPEPDDAGTVQFIALDPVWLRRSLISILVILTMYSAGLWLFGVTGHFLFLILIAWLVAISMEPPIRFLESRGISRGIGTGITMLVGTLVTLVMFVMLGGVFASQFADLITFVPTMVDESVSWLNTTLGLSLDATTITDQFNLDASTAASLATDFGGNLVDILGVAFAILFDLLTLLVFAFFIAADGPKLRRTIASWLPPAKQKVMITVWDISLAKTGGFVVSKVILASISAVAHVAFFALIQLPFWLPMGIFAGFASQLIPTIGTYIGVAVPILIGTLDRPILGLWIVLFATVYQQIENYYLTPRVSRATMDIHPAVALAAVFLGAAIWGPMGALIGIPLAAAIIAVIDTYGQRYDLISEMRERPATDEVPVTPAEQAREEAIRHAAAAVGATPAADAPTKSPERAAGGTDPAAAPAAGADGPADRNPDG